MRSLKMIVEDFISKKGKPTLVVVSRPYYFPVKELLHGTGIAFISIPEDLWPRHRVYIEIGSLVRMTEEINDNPPTE